MAGPASINYPLSVGDVKRRLVGLDAWLRAAAKSEETYDDVEITSRVIPAAVAEIEKATRFAIIPTQYVSNPDGTFDNVAQGTDITGALPLRVENAYPYYRRHGEEYFVNTLSARPVQTVQRMRIMLSPNDTVYDIPPSWLRWDGASGRVWVVPVTGAAQISGLTLAFTAFELAIQRRDHIPNTLSYDYIAGLPDRWWDSSSVAYRRDLNDLFRALANTAARMVLEDISELYDAGLLSTQISGDGLTESVNYTRFQQRKAELTASVDRFCDTFSAQNTPVLLEFL